MDNASYNEAVVTFRVCSISVRTKAVKIKLSCSRNCSVAVLYSPVKEQVLFLYVVASNILEPCLCAQNPRHVVHVYYALLCCVLVSDNSATLFVFKISTPP